MIKSVIILVWVVIAQTLSAQVSGIVVNDQDKPLAFANVILYDAETEGFLKGDVTNDQGEFLLTIELDRMVILEVSLLGFKKEVRTIKFEKMGVAKLGKIQLLQDSEILETVSIVGKKPVFERRSDRTVVNVQNAISSAGSNALEILERSPGVAVDRINNTIGMAGKSGIIVSINGKRTRLEADALIQMLASTPSANIQSVELITNPPASYDAQGGGGVINIVLITNDQKGFNGTANVFGGFGQRGKFGGSINMNVRSGTLNVYGDLSSNLDYAQHNVSIRQRIQYPDQFLDTEHFNERPAFTGNHAGKLGLEWAMHPKVSFGSFVAVSYREWNLESEANTRYLSRSNALGRELLLSTEVNETKHYMISNQLKININPVSDLSIDYDYLNYRLENPTTYRLLNFDLADKELDQRLFSSGKTSPFDFHVIKSDFNSKVGDQLDYQMGVKATINSVRNNTQLNYTQPNLGQDLFFTDNLIMDEGIYAGYFSSQGKLGQESEFSLGVRYEYYSLNLDSQFDGDLKEVGRGRFYPTSSFSHRFNESKRISFGYNERVNRPGFQILAPAFYFLDVHTVLSGNIQALQTISRTANMDLTLGTLFLSFSYSDEDNPLAWGQPSLSDERNILIMRANNSEDRDIWSATISAPFEFTDWWTSRYNLTLMHRKELSIVDTERIVNQGMTSYGNVSQNFKLSSSLNLELSGQFNSRYQLGISNFEPRISTNLGVQKTFAKQSKLSLAWNDIFNTGSFFGIVADRSDLGVYYTWNYDLEGNVFRLTYTHPFGNSALKTKSHKAGSSEIQQRAEN